MFQVIRKLQMIDRRVVYLCIAVVLSLPFLVSYSLPIYPDTYTRRYFDQIETIANDPVEREKVVLVLHNWGPGTSGENEPQFDVIIRHLLRRELRFILLCSIADPVFHDTAIAAFEKAKAAEISRAARAGEKPPSWEYGVHYLDFGYKNAPVFAPLARTIIASPREFYRQDYVKRKDLTQDSSYPLLERYHGLEDVSAVLVVSAGDESKYIAGRVRGDYPNLLIGPATMGIVANDLYPYVKSGQMFGLLNSARAASEYRSLLDPEARSTTNLDNSMSAGKMLLLVLVIVGNLAYLASRRARLSTQTAAIEQPARAPLPPLPAWFMWSLFALFAVGFGGMIVVDCARGLNDGKITRNRVARADDDPTVDYPVYERVGVERLTREAQADADLAGDRLAAELAAARAEATMATLIERRIGEFFMAFCTLGVFAFVLGDNRFYRFIEAIIVGGAMAYLLDQWDKIIQPDWIEPIWHGITGAAHWTNIFWVLLALPGILWYFAYSKKHRWLNQLIVAAFLGAAIGPEFENQINLVVPQILDSIQPIWPWGPDPITGTDSFRPERVEHLCFLIVMVLSLTYFIFFFRPKGRAGNSVLAAGRLAMMVGFGAMFGNTVNTRLSWLAPRFAFLWDDWLGKLGGA